LAVRDAGGVAVIIRDNDVDNAEFMIDMIDDGTRRLVDIAAFFMLGKDGCVLSVCLSVTLMDCCCPIILGFLLIKYLAKILMNFIWFVKQKLSE